MAKFGNGIMGNFKGKLGNTYFTLQKNTSGKYQTVGHQINHDPSNPRTSGQMQQRARFANAVKFYKRAQERFFKFAFEDKKPNESDYNAFMRLNVANSLILSKSRVADAFFPAIGSNWQMSQGSLLYVDWVSEPVGTDHAFKLFGDIKVDEVGSLSGELIDRYSLNEGDIVTIVGIQTDWQSYFLANSNVTHMLPVWTSWQFVIDRNSSVSLEELPYKSNDYSKSLQLLIDSDYLYLDTYTEGACWAAIVVTRRHGSKLMASNSFLVPNAEAAALSNALQTESVVTAALESWKATSIAILQGSISGSTLTGSKVTIQRINGNAVPYVNDTISYGSELSWPIIGSNLDQATVQDFSGANITIVSYTATDSNNATIVFKLGEYSATGYTTWALTFDEHEIASGKAKADTDV